MTRSVPCCLLLIWLIGCGGGGSGDSSGPPVTLTADTAATTSGQPVTIDVLANDQNVTASSLDIATAPGNGTATITGSAIVYTPAAGFSGTDSFIYAVDGTDGNRRTATVSIAVNAPPVAGDDALTVTEDTPTLLDVLANDADSDGTLTGITIETTGSGTVVVDGATVTYTPADDFTGTDTFTYRAVDDDGADSQPATVTITVEPVTVTTLLIEPLAIPTSDYSEFTNPDAGGTFLSSPAQELIIPPNTVSFEIALHGSAAGSQSGMLITDLIPPEGTLGTLSRRVLLCDDALCTAYLPRLPTQDIDRGLWRYRIGTRNDTLANIDFSELQLDLTVRTGPEPDAGATFPATLPVRAFLTAPEDAVTDQQFAEILETFVDIAAANGIFVALREPVRLDDPRFVEVSTRFTDETTAELVRLGDADAANLFFVESFTGSGGQIGIAPGIPGLLGIKSALNGVLVNATVTQESPWYIRTTAEFAFHEMGHLLGLYHTTERDFTFDILADTPECTEANDTNGDNTPDPLECPDGWNPMFWTNDLSAMKQPLTPDQQYVIHRTPIAAP